MKKLMTAVLAGGRLEPDLRHWCSDLPDFGHAARDDVVERGWDLGPVLARAGDRRGQVRRD
jgi:hypothetical protein